MDAARACFIRKGVHATSMQDIFAEAGLSAGAVYRYFKSKNEIIEAIMSTVLGDMRSFLGEIAHSDPLLPLDEVVERLAAKVAALACDEGPFRLAPQAWALAMHEPEIAGYVVANVTDLRDTWAVYVRRLVDAGRLPADTDVAATAKTLFALTPGFLLQRLFYGEFSPDELRRGVRALSRESIVSPPT